MSTNMAVDAEGARLQVGDRVEWWANGTKYDAEVTEIRSDGSIYVARRGMGHVGQKVEADYLVKKFGVPASAPPSGAGVTTMGAASPAFDQAARAAGNPERVTGHSSGRQFAHYRDGQSARALADSLRSQGWRDVAIQPPDAGSSLWLVTAIKMSATRAAPRLFSVPAFRFSIVDPSSAIGKWSRIATMGPKSKDGAEMVFDATTLGQMVTNAEARGDKIAINNDHSSAYPETRDSPALGFFGALAVVTAGKVVKAWNGQPDATGLEDGLYARLDEVTPRGMDPLVGLANYRTCSPMFVDAGKNEAGEAIGYSLLDVGATNVPFQAGAEIMFFGVPASAPPSGAGVTTMADDGDFKIGDRVQVARSGEQGIIEGRTEGVALGRKVRLSSGVVITCRPHDLVKMSAAPSGKGAIAMADPGEKVTCPDCNLKIPVSRSRMVSIHDRPSGGRCPGSDRGADALPAAMSAAPANGATKMAITITSVKGRYTGSLDDCAGWLAQNQPSYAGVVINGSETSIDSPSGDWTRSNARAAIKAEFDNSGVPVPMSATPGAARRFSQGAKMNPEEFAIKCGFAPEDDDAAKLAKAMTYMGTLAAAPFEGKETAEEEKAEKEAMAATFSAMSKRLAALEAEKAARDASEKATRDAEIEKFAADAVAAGYPAEQRAALVTFAQTNLAGARAVVAPLIKSAPAHLMSRVTSQGGPIGGPTAGAARQDDAETFSAVVRQGAKGDKVIEADGVIAAKARDLVESKDPVVMSRVDKAAIDKHGAAAPFYRMLAAQRLAEAEFPHLVPSAR